MPRGVKGSGAPRGKSLETKIADNDRLIEELQAKLVVAKATRKELLQSQKDSEMEAIQEIIYNSGLSADELKELIGAS